MLKAYLRGLREARVSKAANIELAAGWNREVTSHTYFNRQEHLKKNSNLKLSKKLQTLSTGSINIALRSTACLSGRMSITELTWR